MRPSLARRLDPSLEYVIALLTTWLIVQSLIALWFMLAWQVCQGGACSDGQSAMVNLIGQVALIVVALRTSIRMVRSARSLLWTPAAIFPVSASLFFGFGSMAVFLSDRTTLWYLQSGAFPVDSEQLIRVNLLVMTGIAVAICGMIAVLRLRTVPPKRARAVPLPMPYVAVAFLLVGALVQYGLVVPNKFGLTEFTLPGSIGQLGNMLDLGLCIVAYLSARRGGRGWSFLLWIILPIHVGLSCLLLAKKVVMIAVMLPAIGAYLGHRSERRLAVWLLAAAMLFAILQPLNTVARGKVAEINEGSGVASFSERIAILEEVYGGDLSADDFLPEREVGVSLAWLRLNYAGPILKTMELYEAGIHAPPVQSPTIYFIPRVLWPSKPVIDRQGDDFYRIVTGNEQATVLVGVTVYGDGYWRNGWMGMILFSLGTGAILGLMTVLSHRRAFHFIYLPGLLLGLKTAADGQTAFFMTSIYGGLPVYLGYFLIIDLFLRIIYRRSVPRPRRADQLPMAGRTEQWV